MIKKRKYFWRFSVILIILVIFTTIVGCSSASTTASLQGNDMLRSNSDGEVTIDVDYMGYNDDLLSFNIAMNTHSVDLDQYDLAQLSELTDDKGNIYTPLSWDSIPGGHHRNGILTFSQPGSESSPDTLKLVIRNIADIQERTFKWESIPVNL